MSNLTDADKVIFDQYRSIVKSYENLILIVTDWSEPHLDLSLLWIPFKTSLLQPRQPHMHEMVRSKMIGDGEIMRSK